MSRSRILYLANQQLKKRVEQLESENLRLSKDVKSTLELTAQNARLKSRIMRLEDVLKRSIGAFSTSTEYRVETAEIAENVLSENHIESEDYVNTAMVHVDEFRGHWESCGCADIEEMARQFKFLEAQNAELLQKVKNE
jgi:hypothetical protein